MRDAAPPPVLLFDVMDTLVLDPVFERLPPLLGLEIAEIWRRKDPNSWPDFERGLIDENTYFQRFFKDRAPIDGAAIVQALTEGYQWLPGMEALLAELKAAGATLHLLSNYPIWYQIIEDKLHLERYAPWTFVSAKTGRRKPEPEAYTEAAASLGLPPPRCLFIDDREKNCAAAREVGMDSVRFEGAPSLRRALVARGFSIAAGEEG